MKIISLLSLALLLILSSVPVEATDEIFYYDFIAHAHEATWYSDARVLLPFPGRDDDSRGFALYRSNVDLEDNHRYSKVLETHPNWDPWGFIQGTYPEITIPPGTELAIDVGFLKGATETDGVNFGVYFWETGHSGSWQITNVTPATYDGRLDLRIVPLTSFYGKTGRFILTVNANESSGKDWAVWAKAEIRPWGNPVLVMTECPLPIATRGEAYSVQFEAIGGETSPYVWSITGGSLPEGLSLNEGTGLVSGTPTAHGTWPFTIKVCDSTELDGPRCSPAKDCYIQVVNPGEPPPPPGEFDFSLNLSRDDLTLNLDSLVSGVLASIETGTTVTVSLLSGITRTVTLSFSGLPFGVESYCLPISELPTYTSRCSLTSYTSSLPVPGDYNITLSATAGGLTKTRPLTLHIERTMYGDLRLISVEPVQVVYGAPLIKGKGTVFRVRVESTFPERVQASIRLRLPEDEWGIDLPWAQPDPIPADWTLPEIWGPVALINGLNVIMLPIVPRGLAGTSFDPILNPAGIINGRCGGVAGITGCRPDVRVLPRPIIDTWVSYNVRVDASNAIPETDEDNNELSGSAFVEETRRRRIYYVVHVANATEDSLLHCATFTCVTGCCSGGFTDATCAGGSRTDADVCNQANAFAKDATEYILGISPVSDSKVLPYSVDCNVKYRDDYSDFMASMVALARENEYDNVLAIQPWGGCGCCGIGSAGCYTELFGGSTSAAHELVGHGIQRIGYECYACAPDTCPGCTEVACDACGASEGFWPNRWIPYAGNGEWGVRPPTHYTDGTGNTLDRWSRLTSPWRYGDNRELNGGYLEFVAQSRDSRDPTILLIRGTLYRDGSAKFGPFMVLKNGMLDIDNGAKGEYYLVLKGRKGEILAQMGFDASFDMMYPEDRVILEKTSFVYRIEWREETARIELQDKNGKVLAGRDVSLNSPELKVLYPKGREQFIKGENIKIQWSGKDEDRDPLTYSIAVSADGGKTWVPVDNDITRSNYELKTWNLPVGQNYRVRIRATDGVNTTEVISDTSFAIKPVPFRDLTGQWNSLTQTCEIKKGGGTQCKIRGTLTVENKGNQDAPNSVVRFYLSTDDSYDETDLLLRTVSTGTLKVSGRKTNKLDYTLPLNASASKKYVIAVIDAKNKIDESDETNNLIVFGPIP